MFGGLLGMVKEGAQLQQAAKNMGADAAPVWLTEMKDDKDSMMKQNMNMAADMLPDGTMDDMFKGAVNNLGMGDMYSAMNMETPTMLQQQQMGGNGSSYGYNAPNYGGY